MGNLQPLGLRRGGGLLPTVTHVAAQASVNTTHTSLLHGFFPLFYCPLLSTAFLFQLFDCTFVSTGGMLHVKQEPGMEETVTVTMSPLESMSDMFELGRGPGVIDRFTFYPAAVSGSLENR